MDQHSYISQQIKQAHEGEQPDAIIDIDFFYIGEGLLLMTSVIM